MAKHTVKVGMGVFGALALVLAPSLAWCEPSQSVADFLYPIVRENPNFGPAQGAVITWTMTKNGVLTYTITNRADVVIRNASIGHFSDRPGELYNLTNPTDLIYPEASFAITVTRMSDLKSTRCWIDRYGNNKRPGECAF